MSSSRWSCKPSLGPAGSTCSITYVLGEPVDIVGLYVGEKKKQRPEEYSLTASLAFGLLVKATCQATTCLFIHTSKY